MKRLLSLVLVLCLLVSLGCQSDDGCKGGKCRPACSCPCGKDCKCCPGCPGSKVVK